MRDTKIQAAEKKRRAFWPVLGFLLLVALVGISYFAGPEIVKWLDSSNVIRGFPPPASEVPRSQINLIVSATTFVVLAMFASLIVAATLPKKKSEINEKMLAKERAERVREQKARKVRQKMLNNKGAVAKKARSHLWTALFPAWAAKKSSFTCGRIIPCCGQVILFNWKHWQKAIWRWDLRCTFMRVISSQMSLHWCMPVYD
jgi:hypothetical protein